ncbi:MAG TPA: hypothetical protein VGG75_02170 [Trebonia sp.]
MWAWLTRHRSARSRGLSRSLSRGQRDRGGGGLEGALLRGAHVRGGEVVAQVLADIRRV